MTPVISFHCSIGVCTVLFEKHIGCFSKHADPKFEEFIDAVHVLFDVVFDLVFQPPFIDKIVETKPVKDFNKCIDTIYNVADKEVKERIKLYEEKHGGKIDEDTATEFIPYLYYVKEMNLADIKSDIASLMMAAVDTVSTNLCILHPKGIHNLQMDGGLPNLVPRAFCHIGTETKRPWHRLVT